MKHLYCSAHVSSKSSTDQTFHLKTCRHVTWLCWVTCAWHNLVSYGGGCV